MHSCSYYLSLLLKNQRSDHLFNHFMPFFVGFELSPSDCGDCAMIGVLQLSVCRGVHDRKLMFYTSLILSIFYVES